MKHLGKFQVKKNTATAEQILETLKIANSKTGHSLVYEKYALVYHLLRQCHDYEGNILKSIKRICQLKEETTVIELGAGTGSIAFQIAQYVGRYHLLDKSAHMLEFARSYLQVRNKGESNSLEMAIPPVSINIDNCTFSFTEADNRDLPKQLSNKADIVIAGWTLCYLKRESPWSGWEALIGKSILEMERVAKCGATLIIFESLGTGSKTAVRQSQYHKWLETHCGFTRETFRSDYIFTSMKDGKALTKFFFGDNVSNKVDKKIFTRQDGENPDEYGFLPEITGMWWKTLDKSINMYKPEIL